MTHAVRRLTGAVGMVACMLALSGCTATVDPGSAEKLIRSQIGKFGPIVAKSVSCPSGVKKKAGVTFDCKVTLQSKLTNRVAKGTITIHLINGGNSGEFQGSDIHVK